jgi:hypothetical protein
MWAALAAAALLVVAGAVAVLRARTWPAPGRRFDTPASGTGSADGAGTVAGGTPAGRARGQGDSIGAWDALSRGEDPTG